MLFVEPDAADKYLSTKHNAKALYICEYIFIKELKMKQLIAIILATFALIAFAADPAATKATEVAKADGAKQEMKLAKKKADKEAEKKAATKSPTKDTKEPAKTDTKPAKGL